MIIVGCTKTDIVKEKFDNQTINGVTFHYQWKRGIQVAFSHDADDDETAQIAAKTYLRSDEVLRQYNTSALIQ